ncbi:hypothetical protein HPB51_029178 [Rhipicephalus microplus]|uniref:Uncharacterized protein n=1 Tax=Rhipicephalus microplus TaxID=6941 RepID=A0A9J6CUV3_RHIMP|nr:hypothetical protein HPB51_029178 [Rhipicephalus microplus]
MPIQVAVDGEDVSPEEIQSPGWTTALNRRKVKTVPDATGEAPRPKPGVATVSQPRWIPTKVKKQVIAASRMPQLPKDHLRTSSVRIKTPGADKGPWATKAKKTSQPLVKGVLTQSVIFELVSSIQKENATLRSIVEQLKSEIADIKGAKVVNATPASRPNRPV